MSEATQAPPATGTFCWNELGTRDVNAAITFYTELFGWTTEQHDMGEHGTYTIFKSEGTQVGGAYEFFGDQFKGVPPHWLSYVAVDDVDAASSKAESLGAKICMPPSDIPNTGRFSVLTDPTGATIALFKGTESCGG